METILLSARTDQKEQDIFRTISLTAVLTGTLDIIAANIHFYFDTGRGAALKLTSTDGPVSFLTYFTKGGAARLFRYIGKAVIDPATNEKLLLVWGVVFHYIIAFLFTAFLFLVYPKAARWLRNKFVISFVYGLFIWVVMNLVVVPLSNHNNFPSNLKNAVISTLILTIMIGLPVALIAHRFYSRRRAAGRNSYG